MFDVLFDVFIHAKPLDAVAQSLSHLYDNGLTFVRELKDFLAKASMDDCLVATKQNFIGDAQLVSEFVVDSDDWVASISGDPAADRAFDDYAEYLVGSVASATSFKFKQSSAVLPKIVQMKMSVNVAVS